MRRCLGPLLMDCTPTGGTTIPNRRQETRDRRWAQPASRHFKLLWKSVASRWASTPTMLEDVLSAVLTDSPKEKGKGSEAIFYACFIFFGRPTDLSVLSSPSFAAVRLEGYATQRYTERRRRRNRPPRPSRARVAGSGTSETRNPRSLSSSAG